MVRDIAYLKARFQNRDKPDQADYADLIDTMTYMVTSGQVMPSEIIPGNTNATYLRTTINGEVVTVLWDKLKPDGFLAGQGNQVIGTSIDGAVAWQDSTTLGTWYRQDGHAFEKGTVLTCRPGALEGIDFALASATEASPVVGMVAQIETRGAENWFLLVTHGVVKALDANNVLDSETKVLMPEGLAKFSPGQLYYLSASQAGRLTPTQPTAFGQYVTPVFLATTDTEGVLQVRAPSLITTAPEDDPESSGGAWTLQLNADTSCALQSGNNIYVGGSFTAVGNNYRYRLFRAVLAGGVYGLDGTFKMGGTATTGTGFNSAVYTLSARPASNDIYVGGDFTRYNGVLAARLCRLKTDGTDPGLRDETFDPRIVGDEVVRVLTIANTGASADDSILIGGRFLQVYDNGGTLRTATNIAKITSLGYLDTVFQTALGGTSGTVYKILPVPTSTDFMACGNFVTVGGAAQNRVVRFTAAGTRVAGFAPPAINGRVRDMYITADGASVYIFGEFTTVDGAARHRIAKLDATTGALDTTFNSDNSLKANNAIGSCFATTAVTGALLIFVMGDFTFLGIKDTRRVGCIDPEANAGVGGIVPGFTGGANAPCYNLIQFGVAGDKKGLLSGAFTLYGGSTHKRTVVVSLETGAAV